MRKLKLKSRLLAGYLIVIAIMLVISAFVVTQLFGVRNDVKDFEEESLQASNSIKMARRLTQNTARAVREVILAPNASQVQDCLQTYEEGKQGLTDAITSLKKTAVLDSGDEENYVQALTAWMNEAETIVSLAQNGKREEAAAKIMSDCRPALVNLTNIAVDLESKVDTIRDENLEAIRTSAMTMSLLLLGSVIVAIIVALILASIIIKSITKPVQEMEHVLQRLSEGDIKSEIHYESNDELGRMADSLRDAFKTLQMYIGDISRAMKMMSEGDFNTYVTEPFKGDFTEIQSSIHGFSVDMSDTLKHIGNASENVSSGASQISDGAQALSQGATEQASAVEEISATVADISSQVKMTAESATDVNAKANVVGDEIRQSDEKMKRMLSAMDEINKESADISKIIKTIDDISFQTNILALNAAIEAARAGEAGKGFAVVADEVRDLASKSATSANEIATLISKTLESVEEGTQVATETAEALQSVVGGVEDIVTNISAIADNVQVESDSIEQVSTGIEQISSVVQTNSATAEESAATSEELSSQSQVLSQMLAKFHVRENG